MLNQIRTYGGNRLDAESRIKRGRLDVLGCNFFGVKLEALRLGRACGAHYHVKQSHAVFLAGDMIGVTDYQFVAMSAKETHAPAVGKVCASKNTGDCHSRESFQMLWFDKILL
jgi:hypothetical protein